jgi:uncharacterized membrane protein YphA (DoxX/SURF4 family)
VLDTLQRQRRPDEERTGGGEESVAETPLVRVSRALFGGVLAFLSVDNLRNLDGRVEYADAKGAPFPEVSVPTVSAGLLLGSVGVALWRVPTAAGAAIAWIFDSVTPILHDFWNHDDPEQRQQELQQFLKNTALLGAALAFLRLGRRTERAE